MDKIDVDGTPFSVIMDRAVKLKSLQMGEERKKYDKMPAFYQNSIFLSEDTAIASARNLTDFNSRLADAKQIKDEGNNAYREGRLGDALSQYEKAVGIFRYLLNTNPCWKNEGIKDKSINEISYQCQDKLEAEQLNLFLRDCYNNISIVCYKLKNYNISVTACDYALAADEKCDKSYFLRARSRLAPHSCGALEIEAAVRDLQMALELNPKNSDARKLLRATKANAKSQKSRDKLYNGLFDRGEVYSAKELTEATQQQSKCKEADANIAKERDVILGRQLVQHYEERGMEAEKERLKKSLDAEMERQNNTMMMSNVDFRNPTDKMIKDAQAMGVDLSDPQTIDLLEGLQRGKEVEITHSEENDITVQKKSNATYLHVAVYVILFFSLALVIAFMMKARLQEHVLPDIQ